MQEIRELIERLIREQDKAKLKSEKAYKNGDSWALSYYGGYAEGLEEALFNIWEIFSDD